MTAAAEARRPAAPAEPGRVLTIDKCHNLPHTRILAGPDGGQPDDAKLIDGRAHPPRRARDAYVYFDNDTKVGAAFDAQALRRKLDLV